MDFGLALIIIPPVVCGLFFYFLIKIWQKEDKEQTKQAYSTELVDGVYRGKLDISLDITNANECIVYNVFRFKICKGELYNIERIKNRDGYFAVEVTKGFYIVLSGDRVNKYFEKVSDKELKVPKVKSAER